MTRESASVPRNHTRAERQQAVTALRDDLAPVRSRLRTADVERGTVTDIAYNATAAGVLAAPNCLRGPGCRRPGTRRPNTRITRGLEETTTTQRGETRVTMEVGHR